MFRNWLSILVAFSAVWSASWIQAREQPNLVFMIADDCTFRDIGCYGGQAHTPNLDQLAIQGMQLTRCIILAGLSQCFLRQVGSQRWV